MFNFLQLYILSEERFCTEVLLLIESVMSNCARQPQGNSASHPSNVSIIIIYHLWNVLVLFQLNIMNLRVLVGCSTLSRQQEGTGMHHLS